MQENNDSGEIMDLYLKFVRETGQHSTSDIYDENELVDIFDCAADNDDLATRIEVLLYGAQYYPSSRDLMSRRAFLYDAMDVPEAAALINQSIPKPSVLDQLLKLKLSSPSPSQAKKELLAIIEKADDFEDEEAIQLVTIAADLGLYEWLKKHKSLILEHCSYPCAFLYELANAAQDNGRDVEYAVELFEELTRFNAFNINFWQRLALAYFLVRRVTEAENAIENALAINPDDTMSKSILARILGMADEVDPDRMIELLKPTFEEGDISQTDIVTLMHAYACKHDLPAMTAEFKRLLEAGVKNRTLLTALLIFDPQAAMPFLMAYLTNEGLDDQEILSWADEIVNGKKRNYVGAAILLTVYLHGRPAGEILDRMMEIFYHGEQYDQIVTQFVSLSHGSDGAVHDMRPQIIIPAVMAFVRAGHRHAALALAKSVSQHLKRARKTMHPVELAYKLIIPNTLSEMMLDGYLKTLGMMAREIEKNTPPDSFDPIPKPEE